MAAVLPPLKAVLKNKSAGGGSEQLLGTSR